jgi:hypothetical protein
VNPSAYWRKLKERLNAEGNQSVTNCHAFKIGMAKIVSECLDKIQYPETFNQHKNIAQQGGEVARNARLELEGKTGKQIVSPLNAKDKGILK